MSYAVKDDNSGFRAVNSADEVGEGEHFSESLDGVAPATSAAWVKHQAAAMAALNKSSVTIERCYEGSIKVPAAWKAYRESLRAIVRATDGDPTQMPIQDRPEYPAGT